MKSNVNVNVMSMNHVNLHVAFLATYFTKELQKVDLGRKIPAFLDFGDFYINRTYKRSIIR